MDDFILIRKDKDGTETREPLRLSQGTSFAIHLDGTVLLDGMPVLDEQEAAELRAMFRWIIGESIADVAGIPR